MKGLPPQFDPRVTPARADLAAAALRQHVTAKRYVSGIRRRVIDAVAALCVRPDNAGPRLSSLLFGEGFIVYEEKDGWCWGQCAGDDYVGYVEGAALGVDHECCHAVAVLMTHIYQSPELKSPPLSCLSFASRLALGARTEGDFRQLLSGGWVFAPHMRGRFEHQTDILETAGRFLGVPYLWGGRSAFGIDCSGLLQLAFGAAGIALPRDTDQQQAALPGDMGADPAALSLARGDVVFFPGHVGIMADDRHLLHANAHHMAVTIDRLDAVIDRVAAGLAAEGRQIPPVSAIKRPVGQR